MSRLACVLALLVWLPAAAAAGQKPTELRGRVVDAVSGIPLAGARIDVTDAARAAVTDGTGTFVLRGIAAGDRTVRIARFGYADTLIAVTLAQASATVLHVSLRALPPELPELFVAADAAGSILITREAIDRTGARTAGDVVAGVAGIVVRRDGVGGAETVRVRGSDAAAVLVLVDGTPINDPVTGIADLSTIPAASIASLEVLPGARSARFGPRAEAGVIVVRTRRTSSPLEAELSIGALGGRGARVQASGSTPFVWQVGGGWRAISGEFEFAQPAEAGGGRERRTNADAQQLDVFASARASLAGGEVRVRASGGRQDRGLPGKSFAPSLFAREEATRARALAEWDRRGEAGGASVRLAASTQRVRFHDASPPIGLPYDDTTDATSIEAALEVDRALAGGRVALGGGGDARWQRIESTRLSGVSPQRRDAGLFAHAAADMPAVGGNVRASLVARIDRAGSAGDAVASHALTVRWSLAGTSVQLAHRSSFSPPGLDDQFFRDAVGVEPNPSLRAERVPSELALDVAHTRRFGAVRATIGAAAYAGDVRDMIVWAPDYRFVWSPRNVDVRRRGAEIAASLESAAVLRTLRASYGYVRVAYADAPGDVQLEYRPRHTASISALSAFAGWNAGVHARYTGKRYPAAARVNALSGFWTVSADVQHTWRAGPWEIGAVLRVDRVLDEREALIFGFPQPGRVAELRVRLSRTTTTGNDRT